MLEGSTLGGQLLSELFEAKFQLSPAAGCSFFRNYGPQVGPMWRDFCRLLDERSDPAHDDAVIRAADATFDSLAAWLA